MKELLQSACTSCIFNFTLPIGWNEVGVIATAVAVIVALFANRGAKKQLASALKMQEQSKNVSLFEQRIKVIDGIREGTILSKTTIKVLFNEEIYNVYEQLCDAKLRYKVAEGDEGTFFSAISEDGIIHADDNIKGKIREYEIYMERPDCPQEIKKNYLKYCGENEVCWSDTGLSEDRQTYNHAEIRDRMIKSHQDIEKHTERLIELMEKFVTDSIAPIET